MSVDKLKVLVVDDVNSARKTLVVLLRQMGITKITEAKSSQDALDKVSDNDFNLIISDWEMPDADGLQLLKKVKEVSPHKNIPFLMITSASEKERVVQALQAGVSEYAIKPVSLDVLSQKIANVFSIDVSILTDSIRW